MAGPGNFTVDLVELDDVIADVEKTEVSLETLTADLEKQMRALQDVWEGLAADAQQAAQQKWEQGMNEMRHALSELRAAARRAHGNYSASAQANLSMWESVS